MKDYLQSKLQYVLYNKTDMTTSIKTMTQQSTSVDNATNDAINGQQSTSVRNLNQNDFRQQ